jgi:hypothetical protein
MYQVHPQKLFIIIIKEQRKEEVLHTVIEFLPIIKIKKIYSSCNSGFSGMASIYGNVPYILIDDTLKHKDYLDNVEMCVVLKLTLIPSIKSYEFFFT